MAKKNKTGIEVIGVLIAIAVVYVLFFSHSPSTPTQTSPTCISPQILNPSTNTCYNPPQQTCGYGQYFNTSTNSCAYSYVTVTISNFNLNVSSYNTATCTWVPSSGQSQQTTCINNMLGTLTATVTASGTGTAGAGLSNINYLVWQGFVPAYSSLTLNPPKIQANAQGFYIGSALSPFTSPYSLTWVATATGYSGQEPITATATIICGVYWNNIKNGQSVTPYPTVSGCSQSASGTSSI